jgi:H+-transporting ATPase
MIVLLALFNDLPIMMIAYDNAPIAPRPVRWDMGQVLTIASVLGTFGVFSSFGVFWIAWDYLRLAPALVQSVVFLKLLVAGHMTIYLTRNRGPIWERPLPSWKLIVPCEGTQIGGTLAVVYGWFVAPYAVPFPASSGSSGGRVRSLACDGNSGCARESSSKPVGSCLLIPIRSIPSLNAQSGEY